MMQKIYKSGTNRGNRRVWIEGAALLDHLWIRGTTFTRTLTAPEANHKGMVLVAQRTKRPADSDRIIWHQQRHKVAGSDKRPIIDLNGAYLNDLFGSCTHFKATISTEWIMIEPCDAEGQI